MSTPTDPSNTREITPTCVRALPRRLGLRDRRVREVVPLNNEYLKNAELAPPFTDARRAGGTWHRLCWMFAFDTAARATLGAITPMDEACRQNRARGL